MTEKLRVKYFQGQEPLQFWNITNEVLIANHTESQTMYPKGET